MPKSRNRRRVHGRKSHFNNELRRAAFQAIQEAKRAWAVLVAVLEENGGTTTVTQEVIDRIGPHLDHYDWTVSGPDDHNLYTVKLIHLHPHEDGHGRLDDPSPENADYAGDRRPGATEESASGVTRASRGSDFSITKCAGDADQQPGTSGVGGHGGDDAQADRG